MPVYDYIIVGGGSAGSVMAHRLSARSANKVLLCEAGQDTPPGKEPPEIADSYSGTAYFDPRFHWTELKVHTQVVSHNNPQENRPPLRKYEQARVLGGGSSINGQMANRGAPTDYDEWGAVAPRAGAGTRCCPTSRRSSAISTSTGPITARTAASPCAASRASTGPATPRRWPRLRSQGLKFLPDQNGEFVDGYFPVTHSNAEERRVSAAMGYLDAETRKRGEPHDLDRYPGQVAAVRGHALRRRQGHGRRPGAGVPRPRGDPVVGRHPYAGPSHARRHRPGRALSELGIPVIAALPGVGQRLMDHPSIALSSFIRRGARMNQHTRRHIHLGLRYSSGLPGMPKGDMFVAVVSKSAWHAVGEQIASLLTFINKTYSETGQVKLASRDWRGEPVVEFNLLSDKRDLDRLMSGFKQMAAVQMTDALSKVTDCALPGRLLGQGARDRRGQHQEPHPDQLVAQCLDGPAALRRFMIDKFVVEGFTFDQVMTDDEALEAFVRKSAIGVWHASCTCRMGRADDPMAVVDTQGRVRGVQGLRVVDASVFPGRAVRQHEFPDLDDGGEDFGGDDAMR